MAAKVDFIGCAKSVVSHLSKDVEQLAQSIDTAKKSGALVKMQLQRKMDDGGIAQSVERQLLASQSKMAAEERRRTASAMKSPLKFGPPDELPGPCNGGPYTMGQIVSAETLSILLQDKINGLTWKQRSLTRQLQEASQLLEATCEDTARVETEKKRLYEVLFEQRRNTGLTGNSDNIGGSAGKTATFAHRSGGKSMYYALPTKIRSTQIMEDMLKERLSSTCTCKAQFEATKLRLRDSEKRTRELLEVLDGHREHTELVVAQKLEIATLREKNNALLLDLSAGGNSWRKLPSKIAGEGVLPPDFATALSMRGQELKEDLLEQNRRLSSQNHEMSGYVEQLQEEKTVLAQIVYNLDRASRGLKVRSWFVRSVLPCFLPGFLPYFLTSFHELPPLLHTHY
jgi:hypothetical protein